MMVFEVSVKVLGTEHNPQATVDSGLLGTTLHRSPHGTGRQIPLPTSLVLGTPHSANMEAARTQSLKAMSVASTVRSQIFERLGTFSHWTPEGQVLPMVSHAFFHEVSPGHSEGWGETGCLCSEAV